MKGGLGNLMKQAQKMQEDMQKAQEELANIEVTGQAGGGMIKVIMNGRHDVMRVSIDESLMSDSLNNDSSNDSSNDKEMLEDLLAAAINDAVRQVEKNSQEKMSGMTAGLNLPGGMKLPF